MAEKTIFIELEKIIAERKKSSPDESYVAKLMHRGTEKINSKIMEEAGEVCDAALEGDHDHLVYEICDLFFHTLVLAGHKNVTIDEISAELGRRFGTSGLVEKARRTK